MLVVTNYPNVPLSTSNVATDSARTDNQQRPPVLPPPQATKGHEDRAFNPQNERTAEQAQTQAKLRGSVQGKQQGDSQQQEQSQQEQQKRPAALDFKQLLNYRSSLKRSDIKLPSQPQEKQAPADNKRMPNETLQFYRAFGAHIDAFYQTRTQPKTEPDMLTTV
jgi:hypothetical protein